MPTGTSPVVTGMFRLPDGTVSDITTVEQVRAAAANADAIFWVDLDVSRAEEASLLNDVFQFHPLAIEDALNPASRVKVDEYPTFLVVVARVVGFWTPVSRSLTSSTNSGSIMPSLQSH
jgi:Mg2+ and Co2+ transporter CorA